MSVHHADSVETAATALGQRYEARVRQLEELLSTYQRERDEARRECLLLREKLARTSHCNSVGRSPSYSGSPAAEDKPVQPQSQPRLQQQLSHQSTGNLLGTSLPSLERRRSKSFERITPSLQLELHAKTKDLRDLVSKQQHPQVQQQKNQQRQNQPQQNHQQPNQPQPNQPQQSQQQPNPPQHIVTQPQPNQPQQSQQQPDQQQRPNQQQQNQPQQNRKQQNEQPQQNSPQQLQPSKHGQQQLIHKQQEQLEHGQPQQFHQHHEHVDFGQHARLQRQESQSNSSATSLSGPLSPTWTQHCLQLDDPTAIDAHLHLQEASGDGHLQGHFSLESCSNFQLPSFNPTTPPAVSSGEILPNLQGGHGGVFRAESVCSSSLLQRHRPIHLPEPPEADIQMMLNSLPERGHLLQAVMQAGPLLQTLMLAGPLPQWRHPPPAVASLEIPKVAMPSGKGSKDKPKGSGSFSTSYGKTG